MRVQRAAKCAMTVNDDKFIILMLKMFKYGQKHMWMSVFYQIKAEFWPFREGTFYIVSPSPPNMGGGTRPPVHPLIDAHAADTCQFICNHFLFCKLDHDTLQNTMVQFTWRVNIIYCSYYTILVVIYEYIGSFI